MYTTVVFGDTDEVCPAPEIPLEEERMVRPVLVWLGLTMVASAAVAQGVNPAVKSGTKSLNFTFGGFGGFGLSGTGPGGGVGISYFMNPSTALRIGVQVRSYKRTLTFNSPTGAAGTDGHETGFIAGAAVDYLKYMHAGTSRVRPYIGAGIGATRITNDAVPAAATGVTVTETRNAPAGLGAAGFATPGVTVDVHANLGAEFFLFNEISIAGEYSLNVINRTSPASQEAITGGTTVTTKGNPTTNVLGFGVVGATVRIYF
jgi:hypothetical protein